MPTSRTARTTSKPTTQRTASRTSDPDVIDLLVADHKKVKRLFQEFEQLAKQGDEKAKVKIAVQIFDELCVHAQVEAEIFYPAVYEALKEQDLIDEAALDLAKAKNLISQIRAMDESDQLYDEKMKALAGYINQHVEEEEGEIFPKVRQAHIDLEEMAVKVAARKEVLEGKMKKYQ